MPFGVSDLGFGVAFTLKDGFSDTAQRIKQNFKGLDKTVQQGATNINDNMEKLSGAMMKVGAIVAISAPFVVAIKKSAELSDQLADVTKTTGIAGKELQELRTEIESFDTRTSVKELLEIAKAGGSMGVAKKDIAGFTDSVDKMNVALGDQFASPEELARGVAQLSNNLKDIQTGNIAEDLLRVGNVLNFMGANAKATESTIFDITKRMSGLQISARLSSEEIFGVATAMAETGISSEVIGSNFSLAMGKMLAETDRFAEVIGVNKQSFKELANKDSLGALELFAKKLKEQNPDITTFNEKMKQAGLTGARMSNVFLQFGANIENVHTRIQQAGKALTNTDSIMGEFNAKNKTLQAVMDKTGKQFSIAMTRFGDALAPVAEVFLKFATRVIKFFSWLFSTPIGKYLALIAGGIALVVTAMLAWQIVTSLMTIALGGLAVAEVIALWPLALIAVAIGLVIAVGYKAWEMITEGSAKMMAFGAVLLYLMGPIGWVIGGIALITRTFSEFNKLAEGGEKKDGLLGFFQKLGGVLTAVGEIWESFTLQGFSLSKKTEDALNKLGLLPMVKSIGAWMVKTKRLWHDFTEGFLGGIREIGDGFSAMWQDLTSDFMSLWDIISGGISDIIGWFSELYNGTGLVSQGFRLLFDGIMIMISPVIGVFMTLFDLLDGILSKIDGIGAVDGLLDSVGSFFDLSGDVTKVDGSDAVGGLQSAENPASKLKNIAEKQVQQEESSRQKTGNPNITVNTPEQQTPEVKVNVVVGVEEVAEQVNEFNKFTNEIEG